MFSREEASRLKEEFWTAFGKYMSPVPSAEGVKINWVNYHTRLKDVYFRMNTDKRSAMIAISIEHRDLLMQELFYEQFLPFKNILHEIMGEMWIWQLHHETDDGKVISRIYKQIVGVSVFNKEQWPDLISFFKPRIIALDLFWEDAKYAFEELK